MKTYRTTSKVIDALGGTAAVAKMLGVTEPVVSNWRKGQFPARSFVAINAALQEIEANAPTTLWASMIPPSSIKVERAA